jgi:hypothetical protein
VYLAVIIDAWSRRVVGYAISRSIDARLAIAALKSAIRDRYPPKGCIYHSNRRSQYVSGDHAGRDDHAARAVALRKVASVEVTELCLYSATGAVGERHRLRLSADQLPQLDGRSGSGWASCKQFSRKPERVSGGRTFGLRPQAFARPLAASTAASRRCWDGEHRMRANPNDPRPKRIKIEDRG